MCHVDQRSRPCDGCMKIGERSVHAFMRLFIYGKGLGGRGGMETAIRDIYFGMSRLGHEVKILLASESKDASWESGMDVIHFTGLIKQSDHIFFNENPIFTHVIFLKRCLRQLPTPDVILALGSHEVAIARMAVEGITARPQVLSWIHFSLHVLQDPNWLKFADGHLAICNSIANQLKKLTPNLPVQIGYNPTHIDVPTVPRSDKTTHFLYIGRMANRQKRVDRLLHAVSQVSGDWKLTMVGDGSGLKELKTLSDALNISHRIQWTGWLKNPFSHISDATALLLTSDYEGFGLVLIEALARGIPVISSNCPTGPSEIVKPGRNGYLFDPEDSIGLARILQGVVSRTLSMPTIEECRASVRSFSVENVTKNIESALLQFIGVSSNSDMYVPSASAVWG